MHPCTELAHEYSILLKGPQFNPCKLTGWWFGYLFKRRLLLSLETYQAAENFPYSENIDTFKMGEAILDPAQMVVDQPYKFSTHLTASTSLTFPRYLWVVERLACLKMTLLTISKGTPDLEA
jgi:hypothetical protein